MKFSVKLGIGLLLLAGACNEPAAPEKKVSEKDVEGVWLMTMNVGGNLTVLHADTWGDPYSPLWLDNTSDCAGNHFRLSGDTIYMGQPGHGVFPEDSDLLLPKVVLVDFDSLHLRVRLLEGKGDTLSFIRPSALVGKNDRLVEFGARTERCFGACPSAAFRVREDSTFYDGFAFVPNKGHYAGKTDAQLWRKAQELFRRPDLSKEDTTYLNRIIDDSDVEYFFITETDTFTFCCEHIPSQPELTAMLRMAGCHMLKLKTTGPPAE